MVEYERRNLYDGPARDLGREFRMYDPYSNNDRISITMFVYPEKVSYSISRKITGVSENGKEWSRWQEMGKLYLSVKESKSGVKSMNVYTQTRRGSKWTMFSNVTANPHAISQLTGERFIDVINAEARRLISLCADDSALPPYDPESFFDPESTRNERFDKFQYIRNLVYPMFRTRAISDAYDGFSTVGRTFGARALTEMEYARNLFGAKNYRKDLVKAVANHKSVDYLLFARAFRNLVPADWIVDFLVKSKNDDCLNLSSKDFKYLRRVLSIVDIKYRKKLLISSTKIVAAYDLKPGESNYYHVHDALNFSANVSAEFLKKSDFSTWKQLHDLITAEEERVRFGNHPIPVNGMAKKIQSLPKKKDLSIILPSDTDQLRLWGKHMRHCIGTYANTAALGEQVFIAIMKDGNMIGNAQLDPQQRRCIQILGPMNRNLEKDDLNDVIELFHENKILPKNAFDGAAGVYRR